MKGTTLVKDLEKLSPSAREAAILIAFSKGFYPIWMGVGYWQPVNIIATIKSKKYVLTIYVSPDYFALGDDTDYVRMPASPVTYQLIANKLGAILPSSRLVDYIWASAKYKVEPAPQAHSFKAILDVNDNINLQLAKMGGDPTLGLVSGDKKDVVVGPNLNGSKVAIYGWFKKDGSKWQPYSTVHSVDYLDYSHGGRFVLRKCSLNGAVMNIEDIFTDPELSVLVSDQGSFVPYFPNAPATKIDWENLPDSDLYRDFDILPETTVEKEDDNRLLVGGAIAGLAGYLILRK